MPPVPVRQIPRPPSSRAASKPRTLHVSPASPEYEYDYMTGDLGDPSTEPIGWNPLGWLANTVTAGANLLQAAGRSIINQVVSEATDLGSTIYAATTGEAPAEPGVLFNMATGFAESVNRLLPEAVQRKLGTEHESNVAGYITLPDGRRIPVPKARDPEATAERNLSAAVTAAMRRADVQAAADRQRAQIEALKLKASNDHWERDFALRERTAAQAEHLRDLQIRAQELALERETASPAQRALWGRPSTLDETRTPPQRVIRAIGPGLPGAPVQLYRGPAYGRMVGD